MNFLHIILVIVHVLLAAVIFGALIVAFYGVIRSSLNKDDMTFFSKVTKIVAVAIPSQFVVGLLIVFLSKDEFTNNQLVWAKFGLFILAGAVYSLLIEKNGKKLGGGRADLTAAKMFKIGLIASVIIYAIIIILGVIVAESGS